MPIGAIASGVSALIGGGLQSSAAQQAAKVQQQASQQNIAAEQGIYNTALSNFNPTINQGNAAGTELGGLLGIGGNPQAAQNAFQNYLGSTNYNFLLNQGLQGQSYLNAPSLFSGGTEKALNNYAQGMAGNALQGYEGLLQNQQGLGLSASNSLANVGTNIVGQQANARNLAAGAQGSADLYGANAWTNALGGISSAFNQGVTQSSFGGGGALGAATPAYANPSAFSSQIANAFGGLSYGGAGSGGDLLAGLGG